MSRWDETVEFTRRIQLAPSAEAVCVELLSLTSRYGLSRLIAGTLPAPGLDKAEQQGHILFSGWPDAWMQRYLARSYAYVDPVLNQVLANPGSAFSWSDTLDSIRDEPDAKYMMHEAREHGLGDGFAVPMVTLEGDLATISFGGESMDLPPSAAGLIHLVGIFAIGRAFQLHGQRRPDHQSLTMRELDCLRWCGEGKTDWEISVILNVAESTVRSHINSARAKLNSVNKTHMVAEALRAGLIH
jgi:LuxR family quorum sensing-dependent transcriptional regulator